MSCYFMEISLDTTIHCSTPFISQFLLTLLFQETIEPSKKKMGETILLSPTLITEVTALDLAGRHTRQVNHSSV